MTDSRREKISAESGPLNPTHHSSSEEGLSIKLASLYNFKFPVMNFVYSAYSLCVSVRANCARAHVSAVFSLHCGFQGRNSGNKPCMASTLSAQLFEGYTFLRQGLMLDTPPHVVKNDVELLLLLPLSQVQIINVWLACSNLFLLMHFYSYLVQTWSL